MKVFECIFTGCELMSDSYPMEEIENVMYKVKARYVEVGNDDGGVARNVDEDADEGAKAEDGEDSKKKVLDIVDAFNLVESSYDKKAYMAYIKKYMAKVKESLPEDARPAFQANAQKAMMPLIKEFDELTFYMPPVKDDQDPEESMVVVCLWEGGEVPYFYYWKDGVKGIKV